MPANVINDDVVYDGPYELNQLTYSYDAGNGFTAVVSLEDSNSGAGATGVNGEDSSDHYAPDVVAGAGYKAGNFGFKIVGGYDSIVEEGAIKARADADFGVFKAFVMGGWNTDGDKLNKYASSNGAGPAKGIGWGDWAVWGGVTVPFNDKAAGQRSGCLHRLEDLRSNRQPSLEPGQEPAGSAGSFLHQLGFDQRRPVGRRSSLPA